MGEEEIRGLFYVFWLQMFDWFHFILQSISESFIDMFLFTWAQLKICKNCMTMFFLLFLCNYSPYPIETLQEAKGVISVLSTIWILLFFGIYKNIVWFYFLFFSYFIIFPFCSRLAEDFQFFFFVMLDICIIFIRDSKWKPHLNLVWYRNSNLFCRKAVQFLLKTTLPSSSYHYYVMTHFCFYPKNILR